MGKNRLKLIGNQLLLTGVVITAACGGGDDGGTPTDPNNPNPNNPNPTTVPVTMVINGIARNVVSGSSMGYEIAAAVVPSGMEVKYHIANGTVARTATPPYSALFGCLIDLSPQCTVQVEVGRQSTSIR